MCSFVPDLGLFLAGINCHIETCYDAFEISGEHVQIRYVKRCSDHNSLHFQIDMTELAPVTYATRSETYGWSEFMSRPQELREPDRTKKHLL